MSKTVYGPQAAIACINFVLIFSGECIKAATSALRPACSGSCHHAAPEALAAAAQWAHAAACLCDASAVDLNKHVATQEEIQFLAGSAVGAGHRALAATPAKVSRSAPVLQAPPAAREPTHHTRVCILQHCAMRPCITATTLSCTRLRPSVLHQLIAPALPPPPASTQSWKVLGGVPATSGTAAFPSLALDEQDGGTAYLAYSNISRHGGGVAYVRRFAGGTWHQAGCSCSCVGGCGMGSTLQPWSSHEASMKQLC